MRFPNFSMELRVQDSYPTADLFLAAYMSTWLAPLTLPLPDASLILWRVSLRRHPPNHDRISLAIAEWSHEPGVNWVLHFKTYLLFGLGPAAATAVQSGNRAVHYIETQNNICLVRFPWSNNQWRRKVGGNSFSLAHIPSLGYRFQIGAVKQIATWRESGANRYGPKLPNQKAL